MADYDNNNYVFFWGGYLSNFYNSNFTVNGVKYNCNEQYFMKMKQEAFDKDNIELANKILNETNPKLIKKYGRMVKNYDDKTWDKIRYDVMKKGLFEKFNQNIDLKNLLLSTDDKILVEASPFDNIWGIGMNEETAKKTNPINWKGQNLLGKALMEIRNKMK